MQQPRTRHASHAGSWYSCDGSELSGELQAWLEEAKNDASANQPTRAIICPHAGYSYSGPTAAYSFKQLSFEPTARAARRIFILGPSHHHYTRRCELTQTQVYETPLGPISIDTAVITGLQKTGLFDKMDLDTDEAEHSIEMQLPYIAQVMKDCAYTLVPILVGDLSFESEAKYAQALAPYFDSPDNFFVISSDFCHWGKRFQYTYFDKHKSQIWQSIEDLDRQGTKLIEAQDAKGFSQYLGQYRNTICGRHPIGVLLQLLACSAHKHQVKTLHYAQSSQCVAPSDSSVSYVSAVVSRV